MSLLRSPALQSYRVVQISLEPSILLPRSPDARPTGLCDHNQLRSSVLIVLTLGPGLEPRAGAAVGAGLGAGQGPPQLL